MGKKISSPAVREFLDAAKNVKGHQFIVEVSAHARGKFAARIKGRNGEIVMNQENVDTKQSAEYIAARLILGGLPAKYKDLTPTATKPVAKPKLAKAAKAAPKPTTKNVAKKSSKR